MKLLKCLKPYARLFESSLIFTCSVLLFCIDLHYCPILYIFLFALLSTLLLLIRILFGSAVSLLLDQGFKSKQSCYFHPLTNDVTIGMKYSTTTSFSYIVSELLFNK